ncbi:uncharacterized protein TNCV_2349181 [Trichonephila clavipes]|uniref:Uncharacterized protein n=1 Tax=Trichonephila clavipes TaxID=2585209 RepID=A0A8X6SRF1_TRICX|nr:uncharacterized protein TNCV_2349181 [Trichonephila clavipes]
MSRLMLCYIAICDPPLAIVQRSVVHFSDNSDSDLSTLSKTKSEVKKAFRNFKDMQKKFLETVTARLTVAQVVDGVRAGAEPTFDFIMFVLLASMIAALGLLENSSVIIVASMLISPIMGPIMAGTFGAVIRDKPLRNLGIKTEVVGLCLCMFIGFTFGLLSEALNAVWGSKEWPNSEMISRMILSRSSKEVHSSIKQTIRFILTLGARYNTGLRTCPTGDELCFYTLRNIREITSMHSKE